jgi:hypothetical protein
MHRNAQPAARVCNPIQHCSQPFQRCLALTAAAVADSQHQGCLPGVLGLLDTGLSRQSLALAAPQDSDTARHTLLLQRIIKPAHANKPKAGCCGYTQIVVGPTAVRHGALEQRAPAAMLLLGVTACGRQPLPGRQRCKHHLRTQPVEVWDVRMPAHDTHAAPPAAHAALLLACRSLREVEELLQLPHPWRLEFQNSWGKLGVQYEDLMAAPDRAMEPDILRTGHDSGSEDALPDWRRCVHMFAPCACVASLSSCYNCGSYIPATTACTAGYSCVSKQHGTQRHALGCSCMRSQSQIYHSLGHHPQSSALNGVAQNVVDRGSGFSHVRPGGPCRTAG